VRAPPPQAGAHGCPDPAPGAFCAHVAYGFGPRDCALPDRARGQRQEAEVPHLASALPAIEIGADALLIATDVDAVHTDWGTPEQRPIRSATPEELAASEFAAGSMGPKVRAACWFTERTGNFAAIGSITDTQALLRGEAGTRVTVEAAVPTA
jgi:carbamate kinase